MQKLTLTDLCNKIIARLVLEGDKEVIGLMMAEAPAGVTKQELRKWAGRKK
jgi:hypothetical protein